MSEAIQHSSAVKYSGKKTCAREPRHRTRPCLPANLPLLSHGDQKVFAQQRAQLAAERRPRCLGLHHNRDWFVCRGPVGVVSHALDGVT